MPHVTWPQALAWRLRRQLLEPIGGESVAAVVRRLGSVPAQSESGAELAVRARRQRSRQGEVARALADGALIKTYAMRGATHLLTPEDGGNYLALRASSRMWELPSWQQHYGLAPSDWPELRRAVREALADGPLTRAELAAAVTSGSRFGQLRSALAGKSDTLLKPLAWQGELTFGPAKDGQATFQRLADNPRWTGLPDVDEAGRRAVENYLGAYGPATVDHLHYWLGEGLGVGRKRITAWLAGLGDRVATVDVDGQSVLVLSDHVDELAGPASASASASASATVRLLPRYDQWVLGPGTADPHVVPPAQRALVSRGANIVIVGGVVSGTWAQQNGEVVVSWFERVAAPSADVVAAEVARVAALLG